MMTPPRWHRGFESYGAAIQAPRRRPLVRNQASNLAFRQRTTDVTVDMIGEALGGGHKLGDSWAASCPAHYDRRPSLSIRTAEDGKILVYCFAGCSQANVITALRARGLWMTNYQAKSRGLKLHSTTRAQATREDNRL